MLTRRIIPCMDIAEGRVVKGVQFENLRDAGDPLELARRYNDDGADELVFLDITATIEHRGTMIQLVDQLSEVLFIPFCVGGGVRTIEDMEQLLRAGADKVAVNTAAVKNPELITEAARRFGSQFIVISVDVLHTDSGYRITINGGRTLLDIDAMDWAREITERGAGEILLNVIDTDGSQSGFSIDITRRIAEAVPIPVIASGGAGCVQDFVDVFTEGHADAALAASIFHYGKITVCDLKDQLRDRGLPIRP